MHAPLYRGLPLAQAYARSDPGRRRRRTSAAAIYDTMPSTPCLAPFLYEIKNAAERCDIRLPAETVYDNLPSYLVAHERIRLLLLPLGPDRVHELPLHKPRKVAINDLCTVAGYFIIQKTVRKRNTSVPSFLTDDAATPRSPPRPT